MSIKTIAIFSPGNMGSGVGRFLADGGFDVIAALDGRSDFTRSRAREYGIRDVETVENAVAEADLVLSILDPAKCGEIAQSVADAMSDTGKKLIFADCNATSPATASSLQSVIEGAGGAFIDIGIIGGTPTRKENFPTFFASGEAVSTLQPIDGHGIKLVDLGPEIGRGSAIKICNGAWNKGAFALYTAVMLASEQYGFADILRERLPGSQAGSVEKIDSALNRLPSLSGRYIGEMEQVAESFADIEVPSGFHEAAAEIFRMLDSTSMGMERREEIDPDRSPADVLERLVAELRDMDRLRSR